MPWTFKDFRATAIEVARLFVREAFPESPRQIEGDSIRGNWNGREFGGTFRLVDGVKEYRIECDLGGLWSVAPV